MVVFKPFQPAFKWRHPRGKVTGGMGFLALRGGWNTCTWYHHFRRTLRWETTGGYYLSSFMHWQYYWLYTCNITGSAWIIAENTTWLEPPNPPSPRAILAAICTGLVWSGNETILDHYSDCFNISPYKYRPGSLLLGAQRMILAHSVCWIIMHTIGIDVHN